MWQIIRHTEGWHATRQMGTLLSLESVAEVLDYWDSASGPINWRLTKAQVKEVLGQRSDFDPVDIAALDL